MAAHLCSEACDDGNTSSGDGCSAACQAEGVTDRGFFSGTGQGGSIAITVNGVMLNVTTFAGDSAATVASRVFGAINANATLQGLGVTATREARADVIAGAIGPTSNDPASRPPRAGNADAFGPALPSSFSSPAARESAAA
jgi:cysteine-rich repeat protein